MTTRATPIPACLLGLLGLLGSSACSTQGSGTTATSGDSPAASTATVEADATQATSTPAESGSVEEGGQPSPASSEQLGPAINGFGLALWSQLRADSDNLIISPASVHVALTMTWLGAKGETREQLSAALQLDPSLDAGVLAGDLGGQLRAWNSSEGLTLHTANRLFGARDDGFEPAYLAMLESKVGAPLERLDFAGAVEASRAHINQWAADQTEGRILDLVPPGGITQDTGLVLTNAVYFLAQWAHPFDAAETSKASFRGAQGELEVEMMRATQDYPYFEDEEVQVLRMPYQAEGYAMTVVLPREGRTLEQVEAALDAEQLSTWLSLAGARSVALAMPKFELAPASSLNLATALRGMGVTQAFEREAADFSGIANPADAARRLHISAVFHKAFVEVDEQGTEAAAATAVVMGFGRGAPPEPVRMTLDRPFLFFIHDGPGTVLFMGRLAAPAS